MSSRYVCVHCGSRFELAAEEEARCPSCLRKGGLEKVAETAAAPRGKGPMVAAAVVLGIALVAGGGYAYYASIAPSKVEGEAPQEPLSRSEVRGYMTQAGVRDGRDADLLKPEAAAETLAEKIEGDDELSQARSLTAYFKERREVGAFKPFSLEVPRREAPRTQAETLAALEKDDGGALLYPLELAVLATAALREEDVPAMVAEVFSFPNERAPVDPSGQLGYYAVAVPGAGGEPVVVDVYGGHDSPEEGAFRVLTDVEAVAAQRTARAYHLVHAEADTAGALAAVESALALDPRSPSARLMRSAILIGVEGVEASMAEADAAYGIRGDAQRSVGRAALLMLSGQGTTARTALEQAVAERPDYGLAWARLAAIDLNSGASSEALESIEKAEKLGYTSPELYLLRAQYDLSIGDEGRAANRARAVVSEFGQSFEAQLMAAQVFRATGQVADMKRAVAAALEAIPEARREELRAQIEASMGAEALEPVTEADEPLADLDTDLDTELDLGTDLDTELNLGATAPPADGPVLMLGQPSDYQLLGAGDKLELRLGQ